MITFLLIFGLIYALSLFVLLVEQLRMWRWDDDLKEAVGSAALIVIFLPLLAFVWLIEMVYRGLSRLMEKIFT